jgi:hypothetical protein
MEQNCNMTAERSLEIIRESIERSQRTITKNSALPLIWWGCLTMAFSFLIVFLWKHHGGPVWNVLWFFIWPVGYVGNRFIDKRQTPTPPSFVGKTIGHVWATFGIICCLFSWIICFVAFGWLPIEVLGNGPHASINITSIIALCFGMGTTITGFILKSLIIKICGIIAGVGGFFLALQFHGCPEQLYVMAAVALIALIIPGLLVYLKNKE